MQSFYSILLMESAAENVKVPMGLGENSEKLLESKYS